MSGHLLYLSGQLMSRQQPDMKRRIATNIDLAITASGEPVSDIARRMDGGDERSIRRWRSGKVSPGQEKLAALANALGRDLTWFYLPHNPIPIGEEAA